LTSLEIFLAVLTLIFALLADWDKIFRTLGIIYRVIKNGLVWLWDKITLWLWWKPRRLFKRFFQRNSTREWILQHKGDGITFNDLVEYEKGNLEPGTEKYERVKEEYEKLQPLMKEMREKLRKSLKGFNFNQKK
jgi:hypothetical protein